MLISRELCQTASKFQRQFSTMTSSTKVPPGYCNNDQQPEMAIWPPKPAVHVYLSGNMTDSIDIPTADLVLVFISHIFDHGELEEAVRRRLILRLIIPETVTRQLKPEIVLSLELRQSRSKFRRQGDQQSEIAQYSRLKLEL